MRTPLTQTHVFNLLDPIMACLEHLGITGLAEVMNSVLQLLEHGIAIDEQLAKIKTVSYGGVS